MLAEVSELTVDRVVSLFTCQCILSLVKLWPRYSALNIIRSSVIVAAGAMLSDAVL